MKRKPPGESAWKTAFWTLKFAPQRTIRPSAAQSDWRERSTVCGALPPLAASMSRSGLAGCRVEAAVVAVAREQQLRVVEAPAVDRRRARKRHPERESDRRRSLGRGTRDEQAFAGRDEDTALARDLVGLGDAVGD